MSDTTNNMPQNRHITQTIGNQDQHHTANYCTADLLVVLQKLPLGLGPYTSYSMHFFTTVYNVFFVADRKVW